MRKKSTTAFRWSLRRRKPEVLNADSAVLNGGRDNSPAIVFGANGAMPPPPEPP